MEVTSTNHVFVTPTNLLTRAGFTLRGAPGTPRILQHLSAKYLYIKTEGKTKKSLTIRTEGPLIVPYGKSAPGYYITFLKKVT